MPRKPEPWSIKQRRGYWYYKLSGDTSYRSTGIPVGNWKRTRPIAERYALEQAGVGPRARQFETFGSYAAPYFLPDSCPWFTREHGRGNSVQRHYRDQHRSRLEIHILPAFGRVSPGDLSPVAIENWLYRLAYATATKKHILETFRIILRDMYRERLLSFSPEDIKGPVVTHHETATLTDTEATLLFPSKIDDMRGLWGRRFPSGVFLALAYSSGMRTSEIRALRTPAIKWDDRGVVVVETINRDNEPAVPKAKSVRAIPLPAWTVELLRAYVKKPDQDTYVFPGRGDGAEYLDSGSVAHSLTHMRKRLGLSHVTPHGFRHGYNTRMRELLAGALLDPYFDPTDGFKMSTDATDAVLRAFTGHRTPKMTDLYDHPELIRQLSFFDDHFRKIVDSYWDFRKPIEKELNQEENEYGEETTEQE